MRAAAQLDGIAEAHYPHVVAVFLAEERHCAHRASLGDRDVPLLV